MTRQRLNGIEKLRIVYSYLDANPNKWDLTINDIAEQTELPYNSVWSTVSTEYPHYFKCLRPGGYWSIANKLDPHNAPLNGKVIERDSCEKTHLYEAKSYLDFKAKHRGETFSDKEIIKLGITTDDEFDNTLYTILKYLEDR